MHDGAKFTNPQELDRIEKFFAKVRSINKCLISAVGKTSSASSESKIRVPDITSSVMVPSIATRKLEFDASLAGHFQLDSLEAYPTN